MLELSFIVKKIETTKYITGKIETSFNPIFFNGVLCHVCACPLLFFTVRSTSIRYQDIVILYTH